MNYRTGEVWLAQYAFDDDPSQAKLRPVLILEQSACAFDCFKMTKHAPRNEFEYVIADWQGAGLSCPTTIRTTMYIPLKDEIMVRKKGELTPFDMGQFLAKLNRFQSYKIKQTSCKRPLHHDE